LQPFISQARSCQRGAKRLQSTTRGL